MKDKRDIENGKFHFLLFLYGLKYKLNWTLLMDDTDEAEYTHIPLFCKVNHKSIWHIKYRENTITKYNIDWFFDIASAPDLGPL